MTAPKTEDGARFCIARSSQETTIYTNAPGFRTLAAWMLFLADTPPEENYELHMSWELNSFDSKNDGGLDTVWFLPPGDDDEPIGRSKVGLLDGETTFMMVTEETLDSLRAQALAEAKRAKG